MTRKRKYGHPPLGGPFTVPTPDAPLAPLSPPAVNDPTRRRDGHLWPWRATKEARVVGEAIYCCRDGCNKQLGVLRWGGQFPRWQCVLIPGYIEHPDEPQEHRLARFSEHARGLRRLEAPVAGPTVTLELPARVDCPCGQPQVVANRPARTP